MNKQKIAVIGSGISGISASLFLSKKYDVELFEKNNYLGGHTRTKKIKFQNDDLNIDTGFIVFNNQNYPDLIEFFNYLNVKVDDSNMSFSISIKNSDIEYGSNGFASIFAKKNNFFSIFFWKLLLEIFQLYNQCKKYEQSDNILNSTLEDFLNNNKYSENLKYFHIYPMISAIWSCNKNDVKNLPLISFINFFNNHKLFNFRNRPKWKYVVGGSHNYIKLILKQNQFRYKTNKEVKKIIRTNNKVKIIFLDNKELIFDKIIIATHADQALKILGDPTIKEKEILSKFKYSKNYAYLHSDVDLMPNRTNVWSSWNFVTKNAYNNSFSLTYWMNLLQNIKSNNNYFVSINPEQIPKDYYDQTVFEHPIFNLETLKAQKEINTIQGFQNTWFCGSYFGYGFHEDGIQSSAYISSLLDVSLPWERKINFYNRLQFE